jgi:hypothetical protein
MPIKPKIDVTRVGEMTMYNPTFKGEHHLENRGVYWMGNIKKNIISISA